ncbi:MAG: sigma-70 family RNA polymerase sigma factor [Chitinophagaceae bacterium]
MNNTDQLSQVFHHIFSRYGDGLYYYVLKLTGNETTAKDIVQECFLRLWENIETVDTNADLLPLLVTYIKNLLTDDYRKTQRRKQFLNALEHRLEGAVMLPEAEQQLSLRDRQLEIQYTLSQMPGKRQQVFHLVRHEGLSYKETAEKLNLSVADVKKQMRLSLQLLRKIMSLFSWIV